MATPLSKQFARRIAEHMAEAVLDTLTLMAEETERSIKFGSEITGAPGQPVSTGFLRGSWITERFEDGSFQVATNVSYAKVIEDDSRAAFVEEGRDAPPRAPGAGPVPKSTIGGHHSVKLTRAGMDRITEVAANKAFLAMLQRLRA